MLKFKVQQKAKNEIFTFLKKNYSVEKNGIPEKKGEVSWLRYTDIYGEKIIIILRGAQQQKPVAGICQNKFKK